MIDDEQNPHIPDRLAEDLRRAYAARTPPAALDWSRAEHQRRRTRVLSRTRFTAAAGLVLCASLTLLLLRSPGASPYDLNHDGKEDVLDALTLVHDIDRAKPGRDLNDDGKMDQADVEALMTAIVRLPGEAG